MKALVISSLYITSATRKNGRFQKKYFRFLKNNPYLELYRFYVVLLTKKTAQSSIQELQEKIRPKCLQAEQPSHLSVENSSL